MRVTIDIKFSDWVTHLNGVYWIDSVPGEEPEKTARRVMTTDLLTLKAMTPDDLQHHLLYGKKVRR